MRHLSISWSMLFIALTAFAIATTVLAAYGENAQAQVVTTSDAKGTDIGTRRELFVDEVLIESITGDARQVLHHPTPREIVLVCDQPWEGNGVNYVTVLQDGGLYKMYYRGCDADRGIWRTHETVYCYAESRDGVHWERPNLGLVEFGGSKNNNIILTEEDKAFGHPGAVKDSAGGGRASRPIISPRFWITTPPRRSRSGTKPSEAARFSLLFLRMESDGGRQRTIPSSRQKPEENSIR